MSYERYKDFRLAPDDNGCWDVLDKNYQQKQTFPSKAAAKRWIDAELHESNKPQYTVQTTPQDIFVKFEIWVNPKDNYRELEKMLGRLLDAWVTDLKLKGLDTKTKVISKSPKSSPKGKE
jgi:hypothetical protein